MKCSKCHFENPPDAKFCGKCSTQLPSSEEVSGHPTKTLETATDELARGTTFAGRYEIIEELGKGGMGKVYRAEDKKIEEEVDKHQLTGMLDEVKENTGTAYEEYDSFLRLIKTDPIFERVRSDPRFVTVIKKMSWEM